MFQGTITFYQDLEFFATIFDIGMRYCATVFNEHRSEATCKISQKSCQNVACAHYLKFDLRNYECVLPVL